MWNSCGYHGITGVNIPSGNFLMIGYICPPTKIFECAIKESGNKRV